MITYDEVIKNARSLDMKCKACTECNGVACTGKNAPGPGGRGLNLTFKRNYEYLKNHVKLHMDVLSDRIDKDTSIELFGRKFSAPLFCAPIGMVDFHYSDRFDDKSYSKELISGAIKSGIAAFTGGGNMDKCFLEPLQVIKENGGIGIPTLKPWSMEAVSEKMKIVEDSGAIAYAMDIDSGGLATAASSIFKPKTEADLKEIARMSSKPFVVKGVMTKEVALVAARSGAYGIVISNHGGRVLDSGTSTAEMLPEIREAVGASLKIFIDGGIRTGVDVFKCIALGADAVLIGRPYATVVYGGGAEGVICYTKKLIEELKHTMLMTGCNKLQDITENKIKII